MKCLFACMLFVTPSLALAAWQKIDLPNFFMPQCKGKECEPKSKGPHVYSMQLPSEPTRWFPPEADCPSKDALGKSIYRRTSTRMRSNLLKRVNGISFKGLVSKSIRGSDLNEFAAFFHEDKCYNGGGEYGFVFRENEDQGHFYLCANCNIKDKSKTTRSQQTWYTWPGHLQCISGDCNKVMDGLKHPAAKRYWNITFTFDGNFKIQLVDPIKWSHIECIIKKPADFPDLSSKAGYVSLVAHKGATESAQSMPYLYVDEVKVWN